MNQTRFLLFVSLALLVTPLHSSSSQTTTRALDSRLRVQDPRQTLTMGPTTTPRLRSADCFRPVRRSLPSLKARISEGGRDDSQGDSCVTANTARYNMQSSTRTCPQNNSSQDDSCCSDDYTCFTKTFTAGYVFKQDCNFKQVYGHGMINCITVDTCYYPWLSWGIGAKISYLRAKGHTTFLQQTTLAQEVPVTFYVRKTHDFNCGLQAAFSFGGGIAWVKEKNYLGSTRVHKGIGEVEVGLNYHLWRCLDLVSAFRYMFPRQSDCCTKIDFGGCDLRAGIGFSF